MSDENTQEQEEQQKPAPVTEDKPKSKQIKLQATPEQSKVIHDYLNFRVKNGHSVDYAQALVDCIEGHRKYKLSNFKVG